MLVHHNSTLYSSIEGHSHRLKNVLLTMDACYNVTYFCCLSNFCVYYKVTGVTLSEGFLVIFLWSMYILQPASNFGCHSHACSFTYRGPSSTAQLSVRHKKQGVVLTGRNTTGPPSRAAPGELRCICAAVECYRRRQTTNNDDRHHRVKQYCPPTVCVGGPVIIVCTHYSSRYSCCL